MSVKENTEIASSAPSDQPEIEKVITQSDLVPEPEQSDSAVLDLNNLEQNLINTIDQLDLDGLTNKQKAFVYGYNLNPIKSAERAGYGQNKPEGTIRNSYLAETAVRLLRNPKIKFAIDQIETALASVFVASTAECQKILTDIARNEDSRPTDVIAATKIILQTKGALSERLLVEQHGTVHHEHHLRPVFSHLSPGALGRAMAIDQQPLDAEVIEHRPKIDINDVL